MNQRTGKIFILLSSFMLSCNVVATSEKSSSYRDCGHETTQAPLDQCRDDALSEANSRLQSTFKQLKKHCLENEPKLEHVLATMIEQWKKTDRADCELDAYYSRGGLAYHAEYSACLEKNI